jgi:hypothetical protein
VDGAKQARSILDVVKRKRAVGEVKSALRQHQPFEVGYFIRNCAVRGFGPRPGKHPFRQVEADDSQGALLARPSAEPSEAAAKIDEIEAVHLGEHGPQGGPFRRAIQSLDRAVKAAVALKEIHPIVYVLRFGHHVIMWIGLGP